jgi:hypothetical protein
MWRMALLARLPAPGGTPSPVQRHSRRHSRRRPGAGSCAGTADRRGRYARSRGRCQMFSRPWDALPPGVHRAHKRRTASSERPLRPRIVVQPLFVGRRPRPIGQLMPCTSRSVRHPPHFCAYAVLSPWAQPPPRSRSIPQFHAPARRLARPHKGGRTPKLRKHSRKLPSA